MLLARRLCCTDDFSNAALWTHVSGSVYSASRAADAMNPPDTQVYVSDVLYTYVSGSNYSSLAPGHWGYDLPTQLIYVSFNGGSQGGTADLFGEREAPQRHSG